MSGWELVQEDMPGVFKRTEELKKKEQLDLMPDIKSLDEEFQQIMRDLKPKPGGPDIFDELSGGNI